MSPSVLKRKKNLEQEMNKKEGPPLLPITTLQCAFKIKRKTENRQNLQRPGEILTNMSQLL